VPFVLPIVASGSFPGGNTDAVLYELLTAHYRHIWRVYIMTCGRRLEVHYGEIVERWLFG